MATSDRGVLDVERFDLDPARPLMHGLLGDIDGARLAGLSSKDKVPHVLRLLDAPELSPRMAASVVEVGKTLSTWPQLAGEVVLGATVIAEAVRRIGLGEPLTSGRVRVDVDAALDAIEDPMDRQPPDAAPPPAPADAPSDVADLIAWAATRARLVAMCSRGTSSRHVSGSVCAWSPSTPRPWMSATAAARWHSVRPHTTPGWPRRPTA